MPDRPIVNGDRQDAVFRALADPRRRQLLDALLDDDGQTLGQLCARHDDVTRFGVMKHLAVLEESGLVTSHKDGRTKLHYLNRVPLHRIYAAWWAAYLTPESAVLDDLRRGTESKRKRSGSTKKRKKGHGRAAPHP